MAAVSFVAGAENKDIAAWIAGRIDAALANGPAAICVPGGSTPFPIFAELAALPLDWARVTIWPGDDRLVDEGNPASNVGRIREAFAATPARVVALADAARPPHFALTWLGMGEDGHIASLFPSSDPQADDPQPLRRIVPDPLPPEAPYPRLSLTIPALLASDAVMFVIRGESKRALFAAAAKGENDLPVARLLAAARQDVTCWT